MFSLKLKPLAAAVLLVGMHSSVQAENVVSVVSQALIQDPDVLEIANRHMARQGEIQQAKAGYLPTIDLNAGYGYEFTDSPGTRGNTGDHNTEELDRGEFGLVLTQMLWDGAATSSEVDRQEARTASAKNQLSGVAEDVSLAAVKAYLDVQRHREILDLSNENLETHLRIQDQIRLRSDAGVGRRADLDQINARVSLVESNLIASEANVEDAITAYKRRVGAEPGADLEPVMEMRGIIPGSVEEAVEMAMAANPVVAQAASDIEAAQAQHQAAYANHSPFVYLEVAGGLDNNLDGTPGHYNDATAMIKMNYNLYNGGRDVGRIVQTAYQVKEAKEIRNRSFRQLEEEVRLAWAALESTDRQVKFLNDQVDFSIATREAYEKQFNIGQRTLLDLLNTDNELYDAKVSLVAAKTDNLYAQYRIAAAMGKLVSELGVNMADLQKLALNRENLDKGTRTSAISLHTPDFLIIKEPDEMPAQGETPAQ